METYTRPMVMPPADQLLALLKPDPTLLARVLLAMVGGAEWLRAQPATWSLAQATGDSGYHTLVALWGGVDKATVLSLPDPFHDPAAAWRLTVEMGIAIHPNGTVWGACAGGFAQHWVWHQRAEWAASLAALHKHADGELGALIRPTIAALSA